MPMIKIRRANRIRTPFHGFYSNWRWYLYIYRSVIGGWVVVTFGYWWHIEIKG